MNLVICTLFEGDYHFGVAALVNSLHYQGFKGDIFAGYRGEVPFWTKDRKIDYNINWPNSETLDVTHDLRLHLLPVSTKYHLTNYKPDFMLELLNGPAKNVEGIIYFDPDIVVDAPWSFFEDWVRCGIALCEDINSPLTRNHPIRIAWRKYFLNFGFNLKFKDSIYVNGGFVGLHIKNRSFLEVWKNIQEAMAVEIGGLGRSAFTTGQQLPEQIQGPFSPFGKTDQDALNAAVEAWEGEVSFITQEGMGFRQGLAIMPHALGQPKPWNWNFLKQAINGRTPRLVDRKYWYYSNGPIAVYTKRRIKQKKFLLKIVLLISRFYKR